LDKVQTLIAYERQKDVSRLYNIPEQALQKPCIANLLYGDEGTSRNISGLILASELIKNGLDPEEIKSIVRKWNINACSPNLTESQLRNIFKSAFKIEGKAKYDYGCNTKLKAFCISEGKEGCFYYQNHILGDKKIKEPNYIGLRWQHVLTVREFAMLAYFIPRIEGKRQFKKGSRIYAGLREYSAISGINQSYIAEIFKSLMNYGLIEYKAGIGRNWEKKASEVKRILPPPEIPKEYYGEMQDLKLYKKLKKNSLKEGVMVGQSKTNAIL